MLDGFKTFFRPKSILGLVVDNRFIAAVHVNNGLTSAVIERIAVKEVIDPRNIQEELKDFFLEAKLKPELLISSVSASRTMIREIELEFENSKKLRQVIKYQMEPFVPCPIEDVVVDFLPPEPGRPIIVIGVEKRHLHEHLENFSKAPLAPDILRPDAVALYALYRHFRPEASEGAVSIVFMDDEKQVIQVIYQNRLDFIRISQIDEDPESIIKTLRIFELKNPDAPLQEILFTGPYPLIGELSERVHETTGIPASLWRPFDHMKHDLGEMDTDIQARLCAPLALAVSQTNGISSAVDLRREEFAVTGQGFRNLFISMFLCLFIFTALFTVNLYQKLHIKEQYHDALEGKITQNFLDLFPGTGQLVKGQEVAQMGQKISEQKVQFNWLKEISANHSILDILQALSNAISAYPDMKIDNIAIEGKDVRLDGQTSSFKIVENLKERLSKIDMFKETKLVGAKMDNREKTVKYNFILEVNQ